MHEGYQSPYIEGHHENQHDEDDRVRHADDSDAESEQMKGEPPSFAFEAELDKK